MLRATAIALVLAPAMSAHAARKAKEDIWMRFIFIIVALICALAEPAAAQTPKKCPIESVKVGGICIDIYEASAWQIPAEQTSLIKKLQKGKVDLADLTAGGATQVGCTNPLYGHGTYPLTFPENGNWTTPVYAASIAGVLPSACITWFQAEQACALSGKRLLTNQEWQRAAAGTPDPGNAPGAQDCNTNNVGPVVDRANCRSSWQVANMVGNVTEWVGDWGDLVDGCNNWVASFGSDQSCVGGPGSSYGSFPGAPFRGGDWTDGTDAGVFAIGPGNPSQSSVTTGFRCAR
jgi:formylglycine-generating enzyme required for sulfatase activity